MVFRLTKGWALAGVLSAAAAAAPAQVLINEGFDNVAGLTSSGWLMANISAPGGSVPTWFQGDVFTAQSGPDYSYIASNYNVSNVGGEISNWLITPTFSTAVAGTVSFWVKGANDPGYFDKLAFGFSSGGSSMTDFTLMTPVTAASDWTQVTLNFAAGGVGSMGRLAIVHLGPADTSDYVGIDNLVVTAATAVPEPQSWLLMGLGLAGVGLIKSRRREAA